MNKKIIFSVSEDYSRDFHGNQKDSKNHEQRQFDLKIDPVNTIEGKRTNLKSYLRRMGLLEAKLMAKASKFIPFFYGRWMDRVIFSPEKSKLRILTIYFR
jgi:delta-aminolevulinic acid dehydratase/porphobilinogen synthase